MSCIDANGNKHPGPRSQAIHWVSWRKLPAATLERHILECLLFAGRGVHVNEPEWKLLDRKRKRLARLQKEAAA